MDNPVIEAQAILHQENSLRTVAQLEDLINQYPGVAILYGYLGIALLLEGQEEEAQATWAMAMLDSSDIEADLYIQQLEQLLSQEAQRQVNLGNLETAWTLRQHLREINSNNCLNLLHLVWLSAQLHLPVDEAYVLDIHQAIESHIESQGETGLTALGFEILPILEQIQPLACLESWLPELFEACLPTLQPLGALHLLMRTATEVAYSANYFTMAIRYAEICLKVDPQQVEVLRHLSTFHKELGQFDPAIAIAQDAVNFSNGTVEQVSSLTVLVQALLASGGRWYEVVPLIQEQKRLLEFLILDQPILDKIYVYRLLNCTFFLNYIQDAIENRILQNQVIQLCTASVQHYYRDNHQKYQNSHRVIRFTHPKKIKVGYLCHCFREHSVGWLARWLYQHHNRNEFEIYTYFVTYRFHLQDYLQDWYADHSDQVRKMGMDSLKIAESIHQDQLHILMDLDSMTADISCETMALKPAPIQATWLGWDASGVPEIDYYMGDAYALPRHAQSYYQEKIWRLPHSYLQVDGFEVEVPSLSRQDLNIPRDGIVYLSAQSGLKRNPDNIKLQLAIIRQVPNSYFLVKGLETKSSMLRQFVERLIESEGVSLDRVRFLGQVPSSQVHRANLAIADVVLDTYPYNGATTTLETLWMGVPLVTRVGQQFSARNSYTFMMNAGITEGIAWTDEEYVEWGIRLGTDEQLRKEVAWKLRQSRQSAPLWNGKQFTRDMEAAYRQMWERFCAG
jgi:predicted O-linked N-acetylglucosamine transferase (SPINDLY family)